jgi:hypothetical protein
MPLVRDIHDITLCQEDGSRHGLNFQLVAPAGISLQRPPLFLLGSANAAILHDLACQTRTPAIGCYASHAALVAPTGFPIIGGAAFHGDAFLHPRHVVVSISDRLNAERVPIRDVAGKVAVLCGPAHETYGHWLVDFLPRLWVLHQAGHDLSALRFLVPADLRPFALTLLHLCDIPDERLVLYRHWHEILRVEHLLLPTGLRLDDRLAPCFAAASAFWIGRIRHRVAAAYGTAPGLFLSRGQDAQRRLINRSRIEAIARAHGLAIVRPEALSLPEQIAAFSSAGLIAGEYGSALHNAVFAAAGTIVCALRGTARHPSLVQSGIATALGQDLGYVFGATSGGGTDQAFGIDEAAFTLALELSRLAARRHSGKD